MTIAADTHIRLAARAIKSKKVTGWETQGLKLSSGRVLAANYGDDVGGDIRILDENDLSIELGSIQRFTDVVAQRAWEVLVRNNVMYSSHNSSDTNPETRGLLVHDLGNIALNQVHTDYLVYPATDVSPSQTSGDTPDTGMALFGNWLLVGHGRGAVAVFDVSRPLYPVYKGLLNNLDGVDSVFAVSGFSSGGKDYIVYGDGQQSPGTGSRQLYIDELQVAPGGTTEFSIGLTDYVGAVGTAFPTKTRTVSAGIGVGRQHTAVAGDVIIPRFISLSHIEQGYLSLPRGCMDDVLALLVEQSISTEIDDKRMTGKRLSGLKFKGNLRPEQKKAVAALAKHDTGVLHAPTAFGKTVTAIGLIRKRKVSTLILVHSRQLLDQWKERLGLFLEGCEIGMMGGGKKCPSGEIDIATYQSIMHRKTNTVDERLFDYGQIIVDECHHISAPRYEALLSEARAKYLLGITATPYRQDGHQPLIFMLAGPIRYTVKSDNRHAFEQRVIVRRLNSPVPTELLREETRPHIADIYRWLMNDEARNQLIVEDVVAETKEGRQPLVLTERREHATMLADLLRLRGIDCEVLRGAMRAKERDAAMAALDKTQVLIATGKYIGEGFDLPRLDTLFLGLPISWKGSLAQYAGRIHRRSEGKERVMIYDYLDSSLPTLERMFGRRAKAYEALGYSVAEGEALTLVQGNLRFSSQ